MKTLDLINIAILYAKIIFITFSIVAIVVFCVWFVGLKIVKDVFNKGEDDE